MNRAKRFAMASLLLATSIGAYGDIVLTVNVAVSNVDPVVISVASVVQSGTNRENGYLGLHELRRVGGNLVTGAIGGSYPPYATTHTHMRDIHCVSGKTYLGEAFIDVYRKDLVVEEHGADHLVPGVQCPIICAPPPAF